MSQNVQYWLYVILIIVLPLTLVHLFPSENVHVIALLWVASLVPIAFTIFLLAPGQTVHLRNYSNPVVERRLTLGLKALVCVLIVMTVWAFTLPIWRGAFEVYVEGHPFTVINGKISSVSSTVLSPGLYWNLHVERRVDGYVYLFPTVFSFPDKEYELTLLPNTQFVLDVQ